GGFRPQVGRGQDLAGLQAAVRGALGPGRQREVVRGALALAAVGLALAGPTAAAECAPPRAVTATVLGLKYCADPAFGAVIAERLQKIRADVRAQRQAGKLIVYASTPISPRGGGDTTVNLGVAASVKARALEEEHADLLRAERREHVRQVGDEVVDVLRVAPDRRPVRADIRNRAARADRHVPLVVVLRRQLDRV